MIDFPATKEEASKYRYGTWAGNPKGRQYEEGMCAYEVCPVSPWIPYQCSRKAVAGPGNLYCRQHAKKAGRSDG